MPYKKNTGLKRIIGAVGNSVKGFLAAWRHEAAFRQEVILCVITLPVLLVVDVSAVERLLLFGSLMLVLIVELLNSAIEAVVDRASPEWHPLAGRAKDMASAAVLISLILAATSWGTILFPLLF
ncbi:MAG: diacylglycerol kinase [Desulfuromonadaceae bacterium]